MDTKHCGNCKRDRDRSCFGVARRQRDGLQPWCRECRCARQRQWRQANPDLHFEKIATDRARHLERFNGYDQKQRAVRTRSEAARREQMRTTGDGSIDRELIYKRDNAICGICRTVVDWDDYETDHIIPLSKGGFHTAENVQVAHGRCNRRKHDKTMGALVGASAERL